jgi:hypothetical protein
MHQSQGKMRVLKMDLFRTRSVSNLVQNDPCDFYLSAGDPGNAPAIDFDMGGERLRQEDSWVQYTPTPGLK